MGKTFLIIVAALAGILGLAMTACGAVIAVAAGGGSAGIPILVGIVPGTLFLWLGYVLYKRGVAKGAAAPPRDAPPPDAGPAS